MRQLTLLFLTGLAALFLLPLLASSQECPASQHGLTVQIPVATVQGTKTSALLHLQNSQAASIALNLTAGPFVNQTTGSVVPGAKVEFSAANSSDSKTAELSPGKSADILATISDEAAVGISDARIFNAGLCIGILQAVKYDAPLNLAVEEVGTAAAPLPVQEYKNIVISLKNNDDLTYPLSAALYLEDKDTAAKPFTIGPNSSTLLQFSPPNSWFDSRSWFRSRPATLRLVLQLTPFLTGTTSPNRAPASHSIHLVAELNRLAPAPSQFLSGFVVFVVLLLGGFASVAVNSLLPNVLKKISYKKRLQVLADATSGVSVKVDSRLRVLLRLERNRLQKLLSIGLFGTDTADVFQLVEVGINALSTRVTVAQRLDGLRNQFDLSSSSCPPSISDSIDCHLQEAADQLRSFYLTDKNVTAATSALDEAEKILNTLNDSETIAKEIADRHAQLLARVLTFSNSDLATLKAALPGIFQVLAGSYDTTHPVLPANFMEVDDSIARVNVALDYVVVYNTTTDATVQGRIKAKTDELIRLLGTRDWSFLGSARDLVQQMRQNIYVEDLKQALEAKKAWITLDQQVARPYLPLELCICFDNRFYNHAKALQELTCTWSFGDELGEKGWAVCHFYEKPGKKTIRAEVPLAGTTGTTDMTASRATTDLNKELDVRKPSTSYTSQKWFADGVRFVIVFFLALIGLIAGAKEQLAKLDVLPALISVFLLGFGADTIKNILAQPGTQPSGPATQSIPAPSQVPTPSPSPSSMPRKASVVTASPVPSTK